MDMAATDRFCTPSPSTFVEGASPTLGAAVTGIWGGTEGVVVIGGVTACGIDDETADLGGGGGVIVGMVPEDMAESSVFCQTYWVGE